ncbi:DUF721 domain-containing protein [Candidatus Babeliales bacterium]|nr:DUF721 domain-containing protein [Candidatus Babeliales bacterium]
MAEKISIFLNSVFPQEHLWKMKLFQNWSHIIGSLNGKVRIERLEGSLLVLGVTHPAWAQELLLFSNVLRKKINNLFNEEKIRNIRFCTTKLGIKDRAVFPKIKNYVSFENIENIAFSSGERASLKQIKSVELQVVLKKYYVRCKGQKKESCCGKNSKNKKIVC